VLESEAEIEELHTVIEERYSGVVHTSLVCCDTEDGFVEITLWLEGFSASSAHTTANNVVLQAVHTVLVKQGRDFPAVGIASTEVELSDLEGAEEDPRAAAPMIAISVLDAEPLRVLMPNGTIPERVARLEAWIQDWERIYRPLWTEVGKHIDIEVKT
jgi:hypothetical protein